MSPKPRPPSPKPASSTSPPGFYSRLLSPSDLADLASSPPSGLTSEIDLLRVFIRRLVEKSSQVETLTEMLDITRALFYANSCLDRLIKTQAKYFDVGNEATRAIYAALDQLRDEGFFDPDPAFSGESETE